MSIILKSEILPLPAHVFQMSAYVPKRDNYWEILQPLRIATLSSGALGPSKTYKGTCALSSSYYGQGTLAEMSIL